jgi:hypothetical protein
MNRFFTYQKKTCLHIAGALVLIFLSGISSLRADSGAVREPLVISADSWCPYVCSDPDVPGFSVELIREALKLKGHKSIFISAPFERAERTFVPPHSCRSADFFEGLRELPTSHADSLKAVRYNRDVQKRSTCNYRAPQS